VKVNLVDACALPCGHKLGQVRGIREESEDNLHRVGEPLFDTKSLHSDFPFGIEPDIAHDLQYRSFPVVYSEVLYMGLIKSYMSLRGDWR
jgi:hypothetical protein